MARRVLASLDQGTTSTRCLLYDAASLDVVASHSVEHAQFAPHPGWLEHDPEEIVAACRACVAGALASAGPVAVLGLGLATQRETTVVWDRLTGKPLHRAVVWSDTRTAGLCEALRARLGGFAAATGLPISTYFSAFKLLWLLQHAPAVASAVAEGRACFGTVDSWLIYSLTGGGAHVTDVTNASRTGLMNLRARAWDAAVCAALGVPLHVLPTIASNAEVYGHWLGAPLAGVPLCASLGDQHAATLGQRCRPGEAKCTYGTGAFVVLNTGPVLVPSRHGLLTTLAWQLGPVAPPAYALEGAIAVAGSGVVWLRDNLGLLASAGDVEALAASVPDSAGLVFVPAFSGLFAPHWRPDARGALFGLTSYSSKGHVARALLEAVAHQTREVMDAMTADAAAARLRLSAAPLRVDGGASSNGLLLQVTADLLGRPVVRPADVESTARGAALAAGCALGLWSADEVLADAGGAPRRSGETAFVPDDDDALRRRRAAAWHSAVQRTLCWTDVPPGVPRWETRGVARRHALACLAAGAALGAAAAAAYHRYRRASA